MIETEIYKDPAFAVYDRFAIWSRIWQKVDCGPKKMTSAVDSFGVQKGIYVTDFAKKTTIFCGIA